MDNLWHRNSRNSSSNNDDDRERFKRMFLDLLDTDEGFKLEVDKAFGIRDHVLQVLAAMYELKKDNAELMKLVRMLDGSRRRK